MGSLMAEWCTVWWHLVIQSSPYEYFRDNCLHIFVGKLVIEIWNMISICVHFATKSSSFYPGSIVYTFFSSPFPLFTHIACHHLRRSYKNQRIPNPQRNGAIPNAAATRMVQSPTQEWCRSLQPSVAFIIPIVPVRIFSGYQFLYLYG